MYACARGLIKIGLAAELIYDRCCLPCRPIRLDALMAVPAELWPTLVSEAVRLRTYQLQ